MKIALLFYFIWLIHIPVYAVPQYQFLSYNSLFETQYIQLLSYPDHSQELFVTSRSRSQFAWTQLKPHPPHIQVGLSYQVPAEWGENFQFRLLSNPKQPDLNDVMAVNSNNILLYQKRGLYTLTDQVPINISGAPIIAQNHLSHQEQNHLLFANDDLFLRHNQFELFVLQVSAASPNRIELRTIPINLTPYIGPDQKPIRDLDELHLVHLNNDSYPDLVLLEIRNNRIHILMGLPNGEFKYSQTIVEKIKTYALSFRDFNHDNNVDLFVTHTFPSSLPQNESYIYLNQGVQDSTTFTQEPQFQFLTGVQSTQVSQSTFLKSPNPQYAILNSYHKKIFFYNVQNNGLPKPQITSELDIPHSVSSWLVTDINQDGISDFIFPNDKNEASTLSFYLSNDTDEL